MNRKLLYLQTAGMAPNLRVLLAWYGTCYFLLLLLLLIVMIAQPYTLFVHRGIFIGIHDAAQTAKISACYEYTSFMLFYETCLIPSMYKKTQIDPHFQFKYNIYYCRRIVFSSTKASIDSIVLNQATLTWYDHKNIFVRQDDRAESKNGFYVSFDIDQHFSCIVSHLVSPYQRCQDKSAREPLFLSSFG